MKYLRVPIDHIEPDELFAAVCGSIDDRIRHANTLDHSARNLRREAIRRAGPARVSEVWITRHYAAEARRRYAEITAMGGLTPDPRIVASLTSPRSLLLVAWCVITTTHPKPDRSPRA